MLRRALFAFAGIAVAALLAHDGLSRAKAAPAEITGNWQLSTVTAFGESTVCILKVETKDGKPSATVLFSPPNAETTVKSISTTDTTVTVNVKQSRTIGKQQITSDIAFVGTRGAGAKIILGSTGTATARSRAKLTLTDKETLGKDDLLVRGTLPEPMTKAQQLSSKALVAQNKAALEKDAEKRKELLKEAADARKEADEKLPDLYREVVAKHADTLAASDAALNLLRTSARTKMTADEAEKLVKLVQKSANPYGTQFAASTLAPIAETLAPQSGLAPVAVAAIEPSAKALTKDDSAALRVAVMTAYQNALTKAGKTEAAKAVGVELVKLEEALDAEYLKTVPPFKPTAYAGRQEKGANQVAVMELFTGAQCPPCVAADVAFDALQKAYKPSELVLIQYHLHIPGPDPLTNADTVARAKFYGANSTPSTFFNGAKAASGGGGMPAAENKFKQYTEVINPLLEKTADVKIGGRANRSGDKIDIAVEVNGATGDDMKLRVLVVEENIRYVGSNQLRFHHNVVRAMPLGADGRGDQGQGVQADRVRRSGRRAQEPDQVPRRLRGEHPPVPEAGPADGNEGSQGDRPRAERRYEADRSGRTNRSRKPGRRRAVTAGDFTGPAATTPPVFSFRQVQSRANLCNLCATGFPSHRRPDTFTNSSSRRHGGLAMTFGWLFDCPLPARSERTRTSTCARAWSVTSMQP